MMHIISLSGCGFTSGSHAPCSALPSAFSPDVVIGVSLGLAPESFLHEASVTTDLLILPSLKCKSVALSVGVSKLFLGSLMKFSFLKLLSRDPGSLGLC